MKIPFCLHLVCILCSYLSSNMSDSESSETSSSSSEDEIAKPVYILKKQQELSATKSSREVLLSQLELKDAKVDSEEKYAVDDTDDLDPELEYNNWKLREKARFLRDQQIIREAEMEKEERKEKSSITQ